jgi:serine/threonine protein kinase
VTSEGSSKNLVPTATRRGTAVYRAPEILCEDGGFNSKSDIWAFGCIAYELCSRQKAFSSDWETGEYGRTTDRSPKKIFEASPGAWPQGNAARLARHLSDICVNDALRVLWNERPSAAELLEFLKNLKGT